MKGIMEKRIDKKTNQENWKKKRRIAIEIPMA